MSWKKSSRETFMEFLKTSHCGELRCTKANMYLNSSERQLLVFNRQIQQTWLGFQCLNKVVFDRANKTPL